MTRNILIAACMCAVIAPVSAASAEAAPKSIASDPAYRINAGDEIEIYVWGDERLQRALRVLPDGTFAFPLVGTVQASGRTPTDIEAELSKRLADQYKGVPPQVTVSVKAPEGNQISVIGKVRTPMVRGKTKAPVENVTISIDDTPSGATLRVEWGTVSATAPFTVG